jgi:hypothetical protein
MINDVLKQNGLETELVKRTNFDQKDNIQMFISFSNELDFELAAVTSFFLKQHSR